MRELLAVSLDRSETLSDVKTKLVDLLRKVKTESPESPIWFITGVINAEGPEFRSRNRELLKKYGEYIRSKHFPCAFSAVDVFSEELIAKVKAAGAQGKDFTPMWLEFINQGKDVLTGIITTPNWQKSSGSIMEVNTALTLGLSILRMEGELSLLDYRIDS